MTATVTQRGRARTPSRAVTAEGIDSADIAAAAGAREKALFQKLLRFAFAPRTLSLADQAVVSGTSFLTTVAVGRFTVPNQLGAYALVASLIVGVLNVQNALISSPYLIQRHRPLGTPSEHAGAALALCALLAGVAIITLFTVAVGLSMHATAVLEAAIWALAAMAPFLLIREFGRDFAFTHLEMPKVLFLDIGVAATQLSILGWLAWQDQMSAANAVIAIGIACALIGGLWLLHDRNRFDVRSAKLMQQARESWKLGKWMLANLLTLVMQAQLTYWLVLAIAGAATTGVYAACMCVVSLANPLILGLSNIMLARAALAFKDGCYDKLRRDTCQDAVLLGMAMVVCTLVIHFVGEQLMQLLFRGNDYAGYGAVLTALALWQLAHAIGIPPSNALSAMQYVRVNFYIGLGGMVLSLALFGALMMSQWGLVGAACGLVIGSLIRSAARWAVFLRVAGRAPQGRSPADAEIQGPPT